MELTSNTTGLEQNNNGYSALRSQPRQPLADIVPLAAPFTVYLELTNICNFKCEFCPMHLNEYREIVGGESTLGAEDIRKIYSDIGELGRLKTLNLYMLGEPFVNRKITDYISLAKQMDIAERIIVTTNGTLINAATAEKIVSSGLDYIRFSIYGTTQEELTATAGTKIPLTRVIDNIKTLKDIRDRCGSQTPHIYIKTIDTGDAERNARFISLFDGIGDEVALEPVMNWNDDVNEVNFSQLGTAVLDLPYLSNRKTVCPFPFYTLVINADMQVSVCCVDWRKQAVVGDLKRKSLTEIWYGKKLKDFQLAHLEHRRHELSACANCSYINTAPDNLDGLTARQFLLRRDKAV